MMVIKDCQNVNTQFIFFGIINSDNDHKWLTEIKKPEILYDKFKRSAFKRGQKFLQEKKEREKELLIFIYFETRELVFMLIMNLGICL